MATVPDHPILVCITELIRLSREGSLISLEAFGHVVDILHYVRSTLGGGAMPLTADDEAAILTAAQELACELGVEAEIQQQAQQFRFRPRPEEPTAPDEVVLPASGLLLTILLNLLTKWMSDPEMQAKLLAWIVSLFGGGTTMPSTEAE